MDFFKFEISGENRELFNFEEYFGMSYIKFQTMSQEERTDAINKVYINISQSGKNALHALVDSNNQ